MLPPIANPFNDPFAMPEVAQDARLYIRCGGRYDKCGATLAVPRSQLVAGGLSVVLTAWMQHYGGGLVGETLHALTSCSFRCKDCIGGQAPLAIPMVERLVLHCPGLHGGGCRHKVSVPAGALMDFQALHGALTLQKWVIGSGQMIANQGTPMEQRFDTFNPLCPDDARQLEPSAYQQLMQQMAAGNA